jgi:hypothetical protein
MTWAKNITIFSNTQHHYCKMLYVVFFLQSISFVLMLSRMIIYLETIYPKEKLELMIE